MDLDRLMQLRIGHVQIAHRRADGLVAQELLYVGQTDPGFQRVRGTRMAKLVHRDRRLRTTAAQLLDPPG